MSPTGQVDRVARPWVATLAHVVGNVLLGLSLGLFAYYGVTDIQARLAQDDLQVELAVLGPISMSKPSVEPTVAPEPTDWESWEDEDLDYWRQLAGGEVFGRLVIPSIGLDTVVVKGTEREQLKLGPGWIVQTDVPGPTGNCGISGHRTTYGAPFRNIDQLEPGDAIEFYSPYRRYTYEVVHQLVVEPHETYVVDSTEDPLLTLTACHPPFSAAFRLIVQSALVEMLPLVDEGSGES